MRDRRLAMNPVEYSDYRKISRLKRTQESRCQNSGKWKRFWRELNVSDLSVSEIEEQKDRKAFGFVFERWYMLLLLHFSRNCGTVKEMKR